MSPKKRVLQGAPPAHNGPAIPAWFPKELDLVDKKLRVVWHPKAERFLIVTPAPPNVFREGYVVEHVVSKNGQFAPLTMQVIIALQMLRFERDHNWKLDNFLLKMDKEDFEKAKGAELERRLMERDFMKKVHKFEHSTTFT